MALTSWNANDLQHAPCLCRTKRACLCRCTVGLYQACKRPVVKAWHVQYKIFYMFIAAMLGALPTLKLAISGTARHNYCS